MVNNMGVKDYIETTAVFTIEEFKQEFPTVTGYNLLARAIKSGKVSQVTRGLYASATGRFVNVRHDRFKIAAKLAPDVSFAYHSALELLGVAHSLSSRVQYYSDMKRKEVVFCDNSYKQYHASYEPIMLQTVRATAFGEVSVTTKEQTLMDCLYSIGRGGGTEEILRSIASFQYIDVAAIKDRVVLLNSSSIARIGWVLEQKREEWHVTEKDLNDFRNMLAGNGYRFIPGTTPETNWSNRWRLILPVPEEEMKDWLL